MKNFYFLIVLTLTLTPSCWGCAAKLKNKYLNQHREPQKPVTPVKTPDTTAASAAPGKTDDGIVTTKFGKLKGQSLTSRGGQKYYAHLGIPYAETPERFEVAAPFNTPWKEVRDALNYGPICPQTSEFFGQGSVIGDENCLYINVNYPQADRCKDDEKLPVMVLIPPTYTGSGSYFGPHYLMDHCVVFVSFNYRIGALGFLTTNDENLTGNLGLKDSLLALKWVRDNIENFRGNKNLVTLLGPSAGSAMVSILTASPAAKGLFHRVVVTSVTSLGPYAILPNYMENARDLGKLVNCSIPSGSKNPQFSAELKKCLKTVDFKDIVKYQDESRKWITNPPTFEVNFGPIIEKEFPKVGHNEPILTKSPLTLFKNGEFNRVPMISGVCEDEGLLIQAGSLVKNRDALRKLNILWNRVAPILFLYDELDLVDSELNQISNKIRQFYFDDNRISEENNNIQNLTNLMSDRYFNSAILKNIQLHSKYAPVYPYIFRFQGRFSWSVPVLGTNGSVITHGSEAQYIYRSDQIPEHEAGSAEEKFSIKMTKMWSAFAKSGNPTSTLDKSEMVDWNEFDVTKNEIFELNNGPTPGKNVKDLFKDRMDFWDSITFH